MCAQVRQACKTIGHLAAVGSTTTKKLITHDVLSAVVALMKAKNQVGARVTCLRSYMEVGMLAAVWA